MKKILITGASGFIGKHLSKQLIEYNYEVYALVRESTEYTYLKSNGIKIIIDKPEKNNYLEKIFIEKKFNGVIHLSTHYIAEHCVNDINSLITSNILFSTRILDAASKQDKLWFINVSTFWEHHENKDYSPINLYAATKKAFETIAKYYTETTNIKFITIKLPDTYGPDDTRSKIIYLWEKISKSGESLNMSPGDQLINLLHVYDVVNAFLILVENLETNPDFLSSNCYGINSKNKITLKELALLYESIMGKNLNINWGAREYRKREFMDSWNNYVPVPGWAESIGIEKGLIMLEKL